MLRRLGVLTAVLAALATAAMPPAAAAETGVDLGKRVFGTPACGMPSIVQADFIGLDLVAGAADCDILLNRRYAADMPRAMRCTLVLHEYGHLAGRPHSHDRDSVMYWEYVRDDPRCVRAVSVFRRQ